MLSQFIILILLGSLATTSQAATMLFGLPSSSDAQGPRLLAEFAPLRSMMGQGAVRGEWRFKPHWSAGGGAAFTQQAGSSDWTKDRSHQAHLEAAWYPRMALLPGVFAASGIGYERSYTGRMRERPMISNIRYNADEAYDRWAEDVQTSSLLQTVGYRMSAGLFTCALRLTLDHVLNSKAKVVDASLRSPYSDPSATPRTKDLTTLSFYAGIGFN
jgi:hypothetical protein